MRIRFFEICICHTLANIIPIHFHRHYKTLTALPQSFRSTLYPRLNKVNY